MSDGTPTQVRDRDAAEPFYAMALGAADRVALHEARAVGGLADEVALLRALLRRTVAAQPDDLKAIEGGVRLVMQLLVSQQKLSPGEGDALTLAVARVFEGLDLTAADVD